MGIDHRQSRRQDFPWQMVVSDDNIQYASHSLHIFHGSNAAIHRDQETCPIVGNFLQGFQIEAIAFLFPVRYIIGCHSPQSTKIVHQKRSGGHTIHIIVPINHDFLSIPDSPGNALHCRLHVLHQEGVVKGHLLRVQESLCLRRRPEASVPEGLSSELRHIQLPGQLFGLRHRLVSFPFFQHILLLNFSLPLQNS